MQFSRRYTLLSLTRISDLNENPFDCKPLGRKQWRTGDYIVVKVIHTGAPGIQAELSSGRMVNVMKHQLLVGALGVRYATLEATGDWKEVGSDGRMHCLTGAGLMGKLSSKSFFIPNMIEVEYVGHVAREGQTLNMADFSADSPDTAFDLPVVLLTGTSMSAGKTTTARVITNELTRAGKKVVSAKITGAGRYRDILTCYDAGAEWIYDFVDVGLPSTVVEPRVFRPLLKKLLSLIAATQADVAVIEIGASPLEPYNGDIAFEWLREHVVLHILCASDPYAVYGLMKSFQVKPDLVGGLATNTLAGIDLIGKLCEVKAINLLDAGDREQLRAILEHKLGGSPAQAISQE